MWELNGEISSFLELMEKSNEFPELSYSGWLCDLAFAVDIFSHMNELNVKLQGKDQFVHAMYTNMSLQIQADFILQTNFKQIICSFSHTSQQKEPTRHAKKYSKSLDDLLREFCRRFSDWKKKMTRHFNWCYVSCHKTLKQHRSSCNWN